MHAKAARKALVGAAICGAALIGVGTNAAFAGEITGNGKTLKTEDGTLHGQSACAFSGRNDTYSGDPDIPDGDGFFRTQSWGQISQADRDFLGTIGLHPGDACNPTVGEPEH